MTAPFICVLNENLDLPVSITSEFVERICVSQQHGRFQAGADHRGPRPPAAGVYRRLHLLVGQPEAHVHHTHPPGVLQRFSSESSDSQVEAAWWLFFVFLRLIVLHCVQSMSPQFLMYQNCTATFRWETRAACAITTTTNKNNVSSPKLQPVLNVLMLTDLDRCYLNQFNLNVQIFGNVFGWEFFVPQTCAVVDPNTGFEFNLQLLASKSGYRTSANGKDFLVSPRLR